MRPQPLPLRFLLYRGTPDPARCRAEVVRQHSFQQCAAPATGTTLGAPLCGRHVRWFGRGRLVLPDAEETVEV